MRPLNCMFLFLCLTLLSIPAVAEPFPYDELFSLKLVKAARERTTHQVTYDGTYLRIDYPGGDVPDNIGVCTDVIIRSYRKLGIDLQQKVHEDMRKSFRAYPD